MASLCARCGAQISSGQQSCAICGAPIATAAVTAPAQAAAAPAKSGGNAVKIILVVVLVFVGLGILGAGAVGFMAWRIARAVRVSGSGVTVHTTGGTITASQSMKFSASDLGTDIYPGAEAGHGGMRMDLPTGSMVTGIFLTPDPGDKVLAFYKTKFGGAASIVDTQDGAVLTLPKGQQESVMVTITARPSENDGKTQIAIVHTKANKPS